MMYGAERDRLLYQCRQDSEALHEYESGGPEKVTKM